MKVFKVVAVFLVFSSHTIFGGLFDGKWSSLPPSLTIDYSGFGSITGKDEYIWFMAGDDGIMRFNVITNELLFFPMDTEDLILFPLDSGRAGALTRELPARGVTMFDGSTWTFIDSPFELWKVAFDKAGTIWAIRDDDTYESSIDRVYYLKDSQWFEAPFNNRIAGNIYSINFDNKGNIWLTADSLIYCYTISTDRVYTIQSDYMKYITKDPHGNIWFYNDTSLYCSSDSSLILKCSKDDFVFYPSKSLHIDYNGDVWFTNNTNPGQISKFDMNTFQTVWNFSTPRPYPSLFTNTFGVFTSSDSGILYFKDNDTIASTIYIDSIICSRCPNIVIWGSKSLYRKNGSHLYVVDDLSSGYLVERVNEQCSIIPLPQKSRVRSIFERSDGILIAGLCDSKCGLYSYNDHTWDLYPGTDGIRFDNIFEDSKGKIWSCLDDKIIRQTDTGWELIDNGNSNLSRQLMGDSGFRSSLVEDSEHAIWVAFDSSVARTFDGYSWTIYSFPNLNTYTYSNDIPFYFDSNNNVQLLWCDPLEHDGTTHFINRATFKENGWHHEKILFPGKILEYPYIYQDSREVIYLTSRGEDTLFYYNTATSTWKALDTSIIPYKLKYFLYDDKNGKMYFTDRSGQTILFEYNNTSVKHLNSKTTNKEGMKTRIISSNKLTVEFKLDKPDNVSIRVFSPDGKMVKQLFNGFHQKGTFSKMYDLKLSNGMYLIQLQTINKSITTRAIIK
ncbi:MAG: T9SS type A sorting domain-containing protein [Chitinispirillaceae bacterium]|nr:T9SS type A sorting domain-containing protein [Chitinispirillaceae bacterium]